MRIIAGTYRSRVLKAPSGLATRPSSDRLRETLFNVLAPRIQGASFLDLYAGSGAVGIEALSRGAAHVIFVERAPAALGILRANLQSLGIGGAVRVHAGGVGAFLRRGTVAGSQSVRHDVVFLDPPYDAAGEYESTLILLGGPAAQRLAEAALVVAEHRAKQPLSDRYGSLERCRLLEQGDAALSFYQTR